MSRELAGQRRRSDLADLHIRREELLLRSDRLRNRMTLRARAVQPVFKASDRVAEGVRWVRRNPAIVALLGAAALGVVAARPAAFVRLGTRAFAAWQLFQRLQPMVRTLRRYF